MLLEFGNFKYHFQKAVERGTSVFSFSIVTYITGTLGCIPILQFYRIGK